MGTHYSHLSWNDRLLIDKMIRSGYKPAEIANVVGCCRATIYNELKRATYVHTESDLTTTIRYNPEQAEARYREHLKNKGPGLKIGKDIELANYIEKEIIEKRYSPYAVLRKIKNEGLEFETEIRSVNTIYSYIRKGIFLNLSMDHRIVKKKQTKKKLKRAKRVVKGTSIEKRPASILTRKEFGHWEMDTVIGQIRNRKSLLVLTERKSRFELIEILNQHTTEEVAKALDRIERRMKRKAALPFQKLFKTITIDNGVEFADFERIEKSLYRKEPRTKVYYCHPYRSCERGSNENQNKLIRRRYPKGTDFDKELKVNDVKQLEQWMNTYPRRLFGGKSAAMVFENEYRQILRE